MRLTSTLSILSIAALASASILRNPASNLCLDVDGDLTDGAPLIMNFCEGLDNGDWTIDVLGRTSAVLRNSNPGDDGHHYCVALVEGPNDSTKAELLRCFAAERFDRVQGTSPKRWSFGAQVLGEQVALATGHLAYPKSPVQVLPVASLQDGTRRHEWTTKPESAMYQKLYSWMRFQGR